MDRSSFLSALPYLKQVSPVWPPRVLSGNDRCEVILSGQMVSIEPTSCSSGQSIGPAFFGPGDDDGDRNQAIDFDPGMCRFEAALVSSSASQVNGSKTSPTVAVNSSASTTMSVSPSPKTLNNHNGTPNHNAEERRVELFFRFGNTRVFQVDGSQLVSMDVSAVPEGKKTASADDTEKEIHPQQQQPPPQPMFALFQFDSCHFRVFSLPDSYNEMTHSNSNTYTLQKEVLQAATQKLTLAMQGGGFVSPFESCDTPQNSGSSGLSTHEAGQREQQPHSLLDDDDDNKEDRDSPKQQTQLPETTTTTDATTPGNGTCGADDAVTTLRMNKRKAAFAQSWRGVQSVQALMEMPPSAFPNMKKKDSGPSRYFGPLLTSIANDLASSYISTADKVAAIEKCQDTIVKCQTNLDNILNEILPAPRAKQRRGLNVDSPMKCPNSQEVEDLLVTAKDWIRKQKEAVASRHMLALAP